MMVAYSFQKRFMAPIRAGTKRQTIRANRKRHARPGEIIQLYAGMRTRFCERIIPDVQCLEVVPIRMKFFHDDMQVWLNESPMEPRIIDAFAQMDGFEDASDMGQFWFDHHPAACQNDGFTGVLITW